MTHAVKLRIKHIFHSRINLVVFYRCGARKHSLNHKLFKRLEFRNIDKQALKNIIVDNKYSCLAIN